MELMEADLDVGKIELYLHEQVKPEVAPQRIIVMVHMPHVRAWGHDPNRELVYRWIGGPLAVGDIVVCPPTPFYPQDFEGIVTSLDASHHPYKGPVKTVRPKEES